MCTPPPVRIGCEIPQSLTFYSIELISINISSMEQRHHQTEKSCEGELSWGIRPGGATFNTNLDQVLPHIYFSWIIVKLTKSWVFNRFSWWYRGILNIYTSQDLWFLIFSAETCLYFVNELSFQSNVSDGFLSYRISWQLLYNLSMAGTIF